jgi:hypothetical protein
MKNVNSSSLSIPPNPTSANPSQRFDPLLVRRGKNILSGRIPGSSEGKDLRNFIQKRIGV